jgi:hypothetical protein
MHLAQRISETLLMETREAPNPHDTPVARRIEKVRREKRRPKREDAIAYCALPWKKGVPDAFLCYVYWNYGRHYLVPSGDGRDIDEDVLLETIQNAPEDLRNHEDYVYWKENIFVPQY